MKTFNQLLKEKITEACVTSDVNPGNSMDLGLTNHLTPVQNIVTMVRNLFASTLGLVVAVAEDGVSIKMNSHFFVNEAEVNKVLNNEIFYNLSVKKYIQSQGLDKITMKDLGQYIVVYFSPSDVKNAQPGLEANPASNPEKQTTAGNDKDNKKEKKDNKKNESVEDEDQPLDENYDIELTNTAVNESDDDEELQDITKKKIAEIIESKDKVKAAKQLELLVAQEMELPREYYFAGVKSKDGEESIALRWKYTTRRPHKKTAENKRSILNIFGAEKDGVWVQDFDEDGYFKLPDEVKKLLENLLELLGAEETDDKCVWSLEEKKDDKKNDKKDDKKEDKKDDDKKSDDDDSEDDSSRGDSSDDLL